MPVALRLTGSRGLMVGGMMDLKGHGGVWTLKRVNV